MKWVMGFQTFVFSIPDGDYGDVVVGRHVIFVWHQKSNLMICFWWNQIIIVHSFDSSSGGAAVGDCLPCEPGYYCEATNITEPTGKL